MKPADSTLARTGGQILVDALKVHGVDMAFGVPGESYLAVLDALYDSSDDIKFVICRQEGGAAYMAEAYGKLTGKPGICFVTRGPGATNASDRRAHRIPGFDADDPVHRPGRQRHHRARSVPGNRLPPHVRPDGQMGRADRPRRSHARNASATRSTSRLSGRPGPGGAGAARRHADRDARRSPTPARYQPRRGAPRRRRHGSKLREHACASASARS